MSRIVKIFELFFIIGLGLLVTLYVSAPVGVTILLMVFFGMFFSIAVTIATAVMKAIKVTASVSEASVSQTTLFKGEKTILKITVKNRTIIPAADVRIRLITPDSGLNADTEKNIVSFSVAGRAEEVLELEYEAAIWGQYKIGIETVRLGDFLGIFSLPWQVSGNANFEVLVFPNIIEIPPEEIIIGSALEAIYDDEAEETTETALPFGGFPGYNHRDYEPGDPIRRINWKLSAKRDKLLLRLDDEAETPEINICLTASKEALDEDREKQEEAVETALGLADLFVKLDIKVKVHYSNSLFECINSDDIANLQTAFLRYKFSDENYLPEDLSYYIKVSPNSLPELIKA
ncbi:MAG: DUF58 domain-containing protein [Ruminococcus sp.]|jgi:uncharacterized protein (DUF58 family)|nr:DUF58 domain-containing protein [Ruminococcus sp.]